MFCGSLVLCMTVLIYQCFKSVFLVWFCFVFLFGCLFFFFLLACTCFTILCQFMLYSKVNQLQVHMYPLPLGPPALPSSPPRPPIQVTAEPELSFLGFTAGSHWLCHTWCSIYVHPNLPVGPTLTFSSCPHLHLCSCPENKFICTIFLDSTYHLCSNSRVA